MNKILKLLIPSGDKKEISELESWTVMWEIQGETYRSTIIQHKAFVIEKEADEFIEALKECAKFLGTWVNTRKSKN